MCVIRASYVCLVFVMCVIFVMCAAEPVKASLVWSELVKTGLNRSKPA